MERQSVGKLRRLIKRFDAFERKPENFLLVDSLLADAARRVEGAQECPERALLQQRKVALELRLDRMGAGEGAQLKPLLERLADFYLSYKGFNEQTIDKCPSRKMEEVAHKFPAFGELLLEDKALFSRFYKWAIRDNNEIAPFIMFPATCEFLSAHNLSQRTGLYQSAHLKIHVDYDYDGNPIKWLTLRIEGREIPLTETKQRIKLSDGSSRSLKEIFRVFKGKSKHPGDLELLGEEGVTYWPSYKPWKRMDLDAPEFWKTAPPLLIFSLEEVQRHFGKSVPGLEVVEEEVSLATLLERDGLYFLENDRYLLNEVQILEERGDKALVKMRRRYPVDGENFLCIVRATCEKEMSFLRTHAFADVYIPIGEGRYQVFNDGKYPQKYPSNLFRLITDFVRTVLAALQVYDDNVWFNHRNHTSEAIGLAPEEGRVLMEIKRYLLRLSRDDKLGFEFQAEGCAKMQQVDVFKMLMLMKEEERTSKKEIEREITEMLYSEELESFDLSNIPNFFRTSLYLVEPEGFLGCFYRVIKWTPLKVQPYVVSLVYLLFGAWRGVKIKLGRRDVEMSHVNSKCWHDDTSYMHSLYHPGFLHLQQQAKGITLEKRKRDAMRFDEAFKETLS